MFSSRLASSLAAFALIAQPSIPALAETDPASSPPPEQWWLFEHGFVEAWQVSDGSGIKVAVIDTGIDASHPDLVGKVVSGVDFSEVGTPDGLTPVGSAAHHGTMVASLIAGQGELSGGVWGVAPAVDLLSVSIGLGLPDADTDAQVAAGIRWAVDAGADIINLSLSRASSNWPRSWDEALLYAFERDVIVVAALGSAASGPATASAPGIIPGVVTVAGVTRSGNPSDPGLSSIELDVMAAGEELLGSYPGGQLRSWGGASAAAPLVSGLLALILAAEPAISPERAIAILRESATDNNSNAFETASGFGTIDAAAALTGDLNPQTIDDPLAELLRWIELYRPSGGNSSAMPGETGQSLLLPPAPGSELPPRDSANTHFSADSPWLLPLLLAVFGCGLVVSLLLIIRGSATRKTRKS